MVLTLSDHVALRTISTIRVPRSFATDHQRGSFSQIRHRDTLEGRGVIDIKSFFLKERSFNGEYYANFLGQFKNDFTKKRMHLTKKYSFTKITNGCTRARSLR